MTRMKLNKYIFLFLIILLVAVSSQPCFAQLPPPPPPPPTGPPCWPPPCVPVNSGLIYALGAALLFGVYAIYKSVKSRKAA